MDLLKSVCLKNIPRNFDEYCKTVISEEEGSIKELLENNFIWAPPTSLFSKIDKKGLLQPFFGDTTVVSLNEETKNAVQKIQNIFHTKHQDLFAEKINPDTFHITVHDLKSSSNPKEIESDLESNKNKCKEIFIRLSEYLIKNPTHAFVEFKSALVYPCCKISMVMGFIPCSDKDFRIVMNLYNLFEDIEYLDYWPRFHVTIGYFKPNEFSKNQVKLLWDSIDLINKSYNLKVRLNLWDIAYQNFVDMNNYKDILLLKEFRA